MLFGAKLCEVCGWENESCGFNDSFVESVEVRVPFVCKELEVFVEVLDDFIVKDFMFCRESYSDNDGMSFLDDEGDVILSVFLLCFLLCEGVLCEECFHGSEVFLLDFFVCVFNVEHVWG